MPIFQQSVDAELYVWLLEEQKKRKARSIQEVIRQTFANLLKKLEKEGIVNRKVVEARPPKG